MDGIELVIFDCDGVLVDSEVVSVELDRVILAEHGWELSTEEIVERFLGRSFGAVREALSAHLGEPLPESWEDEQFPRYLEAFDRELRAAGMRVLGFAGGLTPAPWLEEAGAEVFRDMRLLPELVHGRSS
ncbi:hypothetical protein [Gulosibacter sp. 10]|uniref:hypothetical protein n=1 Tax=Gulosibacter sp. 10 TaxID=1255570 RepID=UPI00097E9CB6|nr:hypothetical protein [Gulosibacter sp. 10]SJM52027.1 Putative phosphatase YieH [Gulosibacter sp. 10]